MQQPLIPPTTTAMALIPARGGSKSIPRKNLADLGGIPLIAHSILAAKRCPMIDRIIVSTDCPEIAAVARHWGAEIPFLRPAELSRDKASLGDVIAHALDALRTGEGYLPNAVVQLYPTHPFRSRRLMNELTARLLAGYRQVRTVKPILAHDSSHFTRDRENHMVPLADGRSLAGRTFFRSYGLFIGTRYRGDSRRELYLHRLHTPAELIDIDEPEDLKRANDVYRHWSADV